MKQNENEKKQQTETKPYEPPKAVIVLFDDEDVITTSGNEVIEYVFCGNCGKVFIAPHDCPYKQTSQDPI